MRTKNEKILLLALAAVAFFVLNFFGYNWLVKQQTTLNLAEKQLKADQAEAKVNLLQSDTWAKRKLWIQDHEPSMGDEGETKGQVLEHVTKGAKDNKLEIQEQNLNDVQHGAAGTRINVSVKVKGSMQDIVKWLTALEKPEEFYAVSSLSLKADQDQKSMVCSLKIARYFKQGSQ